MKLPGALAASLREDKFRYDPNLEEVPAKSFPMRLLRLFVAIVLLHRLGHDNPEAASEL
jgi:hypothetical protein